MSLTLPTPEDLQTFWGEEDIDTDPERAEMLIELAANLLWLATGLEDDPTDPRLASLVKLAIMDMAIFLFISRDDIDAIYSPFVTERIGSYSYAKAYSKLNSVVISANKETGASLFDALVQYLNLQAMGSWISSEFIFQPGYVPLFRQAWLENPYGLTWAHVYNRDRTDV